MFAYIDELDQLLQETQAGRNLQIVYNNHDIIKTITDEFNYHYFQVGWILQWIRIDPDLTNRDRKVVTVQFLKTGDTVKCC